MSTPLTTTNIINKIRNKVSFKGYAADQSFYIKIKEYVPYICTAIHNGHTLRPSLKEQCLLNEDERLYEEDPHTAQFIDSLPIVLIAEDSRYEYDLNRSLKECIYNTAWDKKIWKKKLSKKEKDISIRKHTQFYMVLSELINQLIDSYKSCLIFDIHSYNYKRLKDKNTPIFNLGTHYINKKEYEPFISQWIKEFNKIKLPHMTTTATTDAVFSGKGYLAEYCATNWKNVLVMPTEIKKIYMEEEKGKAFPLVINELKKGIKKAIVNLTISFCKTATSIKKPSKKHMLSSTLDSEVLKIDRALYRLCKGINLLNFVTPINLQQEKKLFFKNHFSNNPSFRYRQLDLDPYDFKEKLYRLPVDTISDISLQTLYRETIDAFADKIELLAHIGSNKFLYNSLRYYGEPSPNDIENARFLLYAVEPQVEEKIFSSEEAKKFFLNEQATYGINFKIELSNRIVARALVNPGKKTLLINKNRSFTYSQLHALIHHELGIHMVTTENAFSQPLKIFRIGLPLNTLTGEGLAILSEYLSGFLSLNRLKMLSLRVLAVHMMIEGYDFRKTFLTLVENYKLEKDYAFTLTTRVFRGGGFTKDFLYLKGFKKAIKLYNEKKNLTSLLTGKTSFKLKTITDELLERKILKKPIYMPKAFLSPKKNDPILDYLITSIR